MKLLHLRFVALATCLMITSTGQVFADDNADFEKMLSGPAHQQEVLQVAKLSGVVVYNPCPSANYTILNRFLILKPMVFDAPNHPIAGSWIQSVAEKGCGHDRLLNVVFWLGENHSVNARPLLPGNSHTDIQLQHDAVIYAAAVANWPEKDCKEGWIENTKFLKETGPPLDGAKIKPWDELWTFGSCTRKAQVIVHFIPKKVGVTIVTNLGETKFLPNKLAQ